MALPDLTGLNIQDTYQRLLQKSSSGDITDGTGSLFIPPTASFAISASYAISASHEIIKEISSSHADIADGLTGQPSIYVTNITSSGDISASGDIIVEGLTTLGGNTSVDGNLTVGTGYRFKFTNENVGLYRDSNDLRLAGFNSIQFFSEEAEMLSQTERMRLTNQGRLGIGTTSPSEMLTVAGNISASGELIIGSNEKLYLNKSEDTYIQSMAGDIARIVAGGNQMLILDYDTGNRAVFGNGTKVYIGSNNNALPTAELQVQGMISGSGNLKIDGSQVDFTNLPTSDPGVAGRLWNDSNTLKVSAG